MRDPGRIDTVLELLGELWKRHPDLRLGQLLVVVANEKQAPGLFSIEDDVLAERLASKLEGRNPGGRLSDPEK